MATKSLKDIQPEHLDVFREISNIGVGNATTALAALLDQRMEMSVPLVQFVPFDEITDILNGPENIVAGIMVGMSADLNGYILLVLDASDAKEMVSIMMGTEFVESATLTDFSEMDLSALSEISNILVGAYLSAISSLTQLTIIPSVPELVVDMAAAIMSVPAIEYGEVGDSVLFLETEFFNDERQISGHFFLVPDLKSYDILLSSLGVEL